MHTMIIHRPTRRCVRLLLALLLAGALASAPPIRAADPIIYVNTAATGSGDGSSWANAYPELASAIAAAGSGDQIWVAAGTYRPTAAGNRTVSFALEDGVVIYGGFNGTETLLTERDWTTNAVTLSGDLLGNDVGWANNAENSYHVVSGASGATLDGVRISGGNANGVSPDDVGGGMLNPYDSSPVLRNLIVSGNTAARSGGGIHNQDSEGVLINVTLSGNIAQNGGGMSNINSSPELTDVTFSANRAYHGGGMYSDDGSPKLTNVTFSDNHADQGEATETTVHSGGGMYNSFTSPVLSNVTFSNNTSNFAGGGIFNTYSSPTLSNVMISANTARIGGGMYTVFGNATLTDVTISGNTATSFSGGGMMNASLCSATLTNVTISGNTSAHDGGGIANSYCPLTLTNVVISGNTSAGSGGGLLNEGGSTAMLTNVTISGNTAPIGGGISHQHTSNLQIRNSIVWGNSSGISTTLSSAPTISSSLVQGSGGSGAWNPAVGIDGGGNLDADPRFVTPMPAATQRVPAAGDLRLRADSPGIDAGSNTVSNPSLPATDRDGKPRIINGRVDIGAYERQPSLKKVFLPMLTRS